MATASHEHLPGLSTSLSKSHHHAPISDLWGLSLNQKPCKSEAESDYALEIARDISRGPLMSSASSVPLHENSHDESITNIPGSTNTTASSADIAIPSNSSTSQKVGTPSGIWMSAAVATNNGNPTSGSSTTHTSQGNQNSSLMGLAPSTSPTYRGSHSAVVPLSSAPLSNNVNTASAPPGMAPVVVPGGSNSVPRSGVGSIGQFRSGIWGPRQSFSGAFNAPAAFTQPTQPSTAVYGKTPWSMDVATSSAAPVPVQSAGFYNTMPGQVSGSLPTTSLMPKASTPPQSSPSPTDAAVIANGTRMYTGPSPQMQQSVTHHHMAPVASQSLRSQQQQQPLPAVHMQSVQVQTVQTVQSHHSHHAHQQQQQHPHQQHHDSRPTKKNGRPSTNTELYKTELCASFMSTGGNCPYGEKCQFAHGPQELKSVDRPPKWRSKPCQNWVKTGTCSYNERCCFRHDVPVGHGNS